LYGLAKKIRGFSVSLLLDDLRQIGDRRRHDPLEFGLGSAGVSGLSATELHHAGEPVFNRLAFAVVGLKAGGALLGAGVREEGVFGVFG